MADQTEAPPVKVEGQMAPTRGAQVRLTGDAVTAARGGYPGDIEGNTIAKRALEADGTVPDGYTPDGTTVTGTPPADAVVTTEAKSPGTVPAEPGTTRVEVVEPKAPETAEKQAVPAPKSPPPPPAKA